MTGIYALSKHYFTGKVDKIIVPKLNILTKLRKNNANQAKRHTKLLQISERIGVNLIKQHVFSCPPQQSS